MLSQSTKVLLVTMLTLSAPKVALAQVGAEKYTTYCEVFGKPSTCTVVDTYTSNGFLDTRAIYNNRYGYTMKQRFVGAKGFLTWDSYNGKVYSYPYQVKGGLSRVTPDLVVDGVGLD
jgi:hypothetical protein